MAACNLAIKDTVTGLWLKTYSVEIENCVFSGPADSMCCDNLTPEEFQAIVDNMNNLTSPNRFIGQNPPIR